MAEKIAQRAASRENARRIMNSPAEEYNLFSEILMRGRERGGFTEDEMLVLEEAGFLDNIRTFDEDFISPEPPDEYYEALDREEERKEAARIKENMIRFGEEDPPTPEGKKQYRKVPGYPKSKIKDLERGPDQFFDIYASKRMT